MYARPRSTTNSTAGPWDARPRTSLYDTCRRFKYEIFTDAGRWMHNVGYQFRACGEDKVQCKKDKVQCLSTCGGSDGAEYKHDFATIVSSTELSQFALGDGFDTQAAADCTVRSYIFKVPVFQGGDSFATFAARMRVRSGMTAIDKKFCEENALSCGAIQNLLEKAPGLVFVNGQFRHKYSLVPPSPPPDPSPPPRAFAYAPPALATTTAREPAALLRGRRGLPAAAAPHRLRPGHHHRRRGPRPSARAASSRAASLTRSAGGTCAHRLPPPPPPVTIARHRGRGQPVAAADLGDLEAYEAPRKTDRAQWADDTSAAMLGTEALIDALGEQPHSRHAQAAGGDLRGGIERGRRPGSRRRLRRRDHGPPARHPQGVQRAHDRRADHRRDRVLRQGWHPGRDRRLVRALCGPRRGWTRAPTAIARPTLQARRALSYVDKTGWCYLLQNAGACKMEDFGVELYTRQIQSSASARPPRPDLTTPVHRPALDARRCAPAHARRCGRDGRGCPTTTARRPAQAPARCRHRRGGHVLAFARQQASRLWAASPSTEAGDVPHAWPPRTRARSFSARTRAAASSSPRGLGPRHVPHIKRTTPSRRRACSRWPRPPPPRPRCAGAAPRPGARRRALGPAPRSGSTCARKCARASWPSARAGWRASRTARPAWPSPRVWASTSRSRATA